MKQNKAETSFTKTWFILYPFIVYMATKTIALLCISLFIVSLQEDINMVNKLPFLANKQLCSAVGNAIASIIGVSFLYRKFLDETTFRGEYDPDANVWKQTIMRLTTSLQTHGHKWLAFLCVLCLGGISAIALNLFVQLLPLQSPTYEAVEQIQYGVPVWLGLILYGLISPVVEEIVFRGMLYNRTKRYFHKALAIGISAFMFGAFHGNIMQGIYGCLMGALITLAYDWTNSFWGAVLYHMSANVVVYILSTCFPNLVICSVLNCVIFVTISFAGWILLYKCCQNKEK